MDESLVVNTRPGGITTGRPMEVALGTRMTLPDPLKLADGTVLTHSRAILAWAEEQPAA